MNLIQFKNFDLLDIGTKLEIKGVVYGGDSDNYDMIIMLPNELIQPTTDVLFPTLEEWVQIIRQSDLKEVEVVGGDKNKKIILRKSTRQIETSVMWEVFRRDSFTCRYCNKNDVPMTVDHVVLWEEGGPSILTNLICSCKKCNNRRNNMQYEDWVVSESYKAVSHRLSDTDKLRNTLVLDVIPDIREHHMRVNKRSR